MQNCWLPQFVTVEVVPEATRHCQVCSNTMQAPCGLVSTQLDPTWLQPRSRSGWQSSVEFCERQLYSEVVRQQSR
jgi:hypothetical protein